MFDRILVPTDGSDRALKSAERAVELAGMVGGEVHFLYVVDNTLIGGLPEEGFWEQMEGVLRDEGEKTLKELEAFSKSREVEAKAVVLEGTPHREITRYAEDNDVDLIVIATAGRRGLDRLLLGSTTDRVLRDTGCPVMVIRIIRSEESE